jgi:hypothetical protein
MWVLREVHIHKRDFLIFFHRTVLDFKVVEERRAFGEMQVLIVRVLDVQFLCSVCTIDA